MVDTPTLPYTTHPGVSEMLCAEFSVWTGLRLKWGSVTKSCTDINGTSLLALSHTLQSFNL